MSRHGETGTAPVLEVFDLAISFSQPRPAVNSVSVHVDRGEVVALVGESGSGKSMTARAVLGILPPGAVATGSVKVHGQEVLNASESVLRQVRGRQVGMVFQEPQTALNPVRTIGWQIREALRAHGHTTRVAARRRAVELLRDVEMPEPEVRVDHYPHQLSGGQKQRVVLALALANEPDLLLADEPTTALDVTVQAEILDLLRRVRERLGTSILLITHNMGVVADMADRVVVLRTGDVVEQAVTEELFARPQHAYTRTLLDSVLRLPDGSDGLSTEALPAADDPEDSAALRFEDVSITYPAHHGRPAFEAVRGVTLGLRPGEVLGLVGESGSGKTTLGRGAAGLVPVSAGSVVVDGIDLARTTRSQLRDVRKSLAFVHQDPASSLNPRMTVGDCVREPLDLHKVGDQASRRARVAELLDAVLLTTDLAERLPRELSGGQRQRVALARALALQPTLVIADEPTSALDVSVQEEVLQLFTRLQEEIGFAAVFISHDLAVVHHVAHRVAVLREGEVLETGPVEDVFAHPRHDYTRRLIDAVPGRELTSFRDRRQGQVQVAS
jgi:peptide/nickel transport system ATP-binding protein